MKRYYGMNTFACFCPFVFLLVSAPLFSGAVKLALVMLVAVLFLLALFRTDFAIIVLIFSMLLSPELPIANIPGRAVVVRFDDIFLFVIFFGWLAKMAVNKQLGLLRHTPLNKFIISYILICIVATLIGILSNTASMLKSLFYILKYIEYFLLYFLVTNNIRDKRQVKIFLTVFLLTGFIVCFYGWSQIGSGIRITTPFEGVKGEPNTLGGYLLLLFAACAGLFIYSPSAAWRYAAGALACFIVPPFILTLSRSSYLAFILMYLALIILSTKKKIMLAALLIITVIFGPLLLPQFAKVVTRRVETTFGKHISPSMMRLAFGRHIPLERSAAARIYNWFDIFAKVSKRPVFGYGVTGVGLVDVQYARVLGETGIVGFSAFITLLVVIFRQGLRIFIGMKDEWFKGLALGFLAGFIGLLVQGFGANTFIIVRIMEPFWFLAAVVMTLPALTNSEEAAG